MAQLAGSLEIQIFAEIARLRKDMEKANGIVAKSTKSMESSIASLQSAFVSLGAGLSIGAVVAYGKSIIDLADNMNDLSQRVGIGIKDLATWQLAANQSGTSIESVAKGVKGLSVYMAENSKKLREAGITATDANGAMKQLADLFAAMPDGVQKTALAVQLFGKAGMEMIPMLNMGSKGLEEAQAKAKAYGDKLAELAPKADEFNDLMAEFALQSKVAGMNIADYFLPGLIGMAQWLNDIAKGGKAAQDAVEWMMGERPMKALVLAGHPLLTGGSSRSASGRIGVAPGMTLAEEIALGEKNIAGLRAAGLLDKGGNAKASKAQIFGPELPYYAAAALKEEAAFAARAKAFIDQHDARAEMYRIETEGEEAVREAMEKTNAAMTKEAWNESQNAAKKAAEESARAWQDFTRDIESALTDALMRSFEAGDSFGEAFAKNLENIFKTMILKAVVQITVGTVVGAASQALGINVGGAGSVGSSAGGALSLLSTGQSLYGAFTGGTAASLGGLIGGSFGAGMQGASLAAGLAGPTTAGATGAMGAGAMAASAIPWVAGALALASLFGGKLFGGKESPPEAYINQFRSRNVPAANTAYLNSIGGMGTDTPFGFLAFATQHMDGDAVARNTQYTNQYLKPVSAADKLVAEMLSEAEIDKVSGAFGAGEVWSLGGNPNNADGALMRRFARISNAIGGWVDKLADSTEGTLQESYTELVQLLSIRGNAEMEKLANDMFSALGKWDYQRFTALQAGVMGFNDMFKTDAERFADYSEAMHKAFDDLNIALPESRDGFKALVEGIDTSTKAGFDLYATLIDLSPTMGAYYDALNQELNIKRQLAGMSESGFSNAVDYRRYQGVAANYDPTFAGDYAYNIRLGAIKPGSAANADIVSELRALRSDQQAQSLAIAANTQDTAKILRRWNGDGMPAERDVA